MKLVQLSPVKKASSIKAWIDEFGTRTLKDLPKNVATGCGSNGIKSHTICCSINSTFY